MFEWVKTLLSPWQPDARAAVLQDRLEQWLRMASGLRDRGDLQGAEDLCYRILEAAPEHAPALCLLGDIASTRGDGDEAEGLLRRAVSIAADLPHAHYALGCVLGARGDSAGAEQSYRRVLDLAPDHAAARINLGCILQARGEDGSGVAGPPGELAERQIEEALVHFTAAAESAPASPDSWINLGYALARQRRPNEARRAYDRALAIEPGNALARVNRAMALLALGRWPEAWGDYEWRWPAGGFPRPAFDRPEWDGSPLAGRAILLYTEQGFGDSIQFARYVPLLAARGARVILRCQPELKRLFGSLPGVANVIGADEALPEFDVHCALLAVPRLVGTTVETVPAAMPYLFAHAADRGGRGKPRIGLVWASQSQFPGAALKSVPLGALAPLENLAGLEFCSLQMGAAGSPRSLASAPFALRDLTTGIRDFADTAALIAGLDLTISVDTAVAHLAGAMGRPVWTLLPYVADWRWEPDEASCRWYPGMRLFRQQRRGDWGEVLSRVAEQLRGLTRDTATSPT